VALEQVLSWYFGFPCQFSFHRMLHTHHHLSSGAGTTGQLVAEVPSGLSLTPPQETSEFMYQGDTSSYYLIRLATIRNRDRGSLPLLPIRQNLTHMVRRLHHTKKDFSFSSGSIQLRWQVGSIRAEADASLRFGWTAFFLGWLVFMTQVSYTRSVRSVTFKRREMKSM
jgi:hypothetical protein